MYFGVDVLIGLKGSIVNLLCRNVDVSIKSCTPNPTIFKPSCKRTIILNLIGQSAGLYLCVSIF